MDSEYSSKIEPSWCFMTKALPSNDDLVYTPVYQIKKKHFWFVLTLPPNYREGSTTSLVTWTTNEQRCYNGRENTLSETLMGRYQLIKKNMIVT